MKIAVIGALGFVGTNICLDLLKKGNKVIAIDNHFKEIGTYENQSLIESSGGYFQYVDIRNRNDVETFFRNEKNIDACFHVAAQVAFKRSIENPRLDFEINTLGTFNILESIRLYQPEVKFVYFSTNQVYGALPKIPIIEKETRYDYANMPGGIPEDYPVDFLSPYGCSKGAADFYTIDYARVFGLRTVVIRLGGIYGQYQYSYEDHGWVAYMTKMVVRNSIFNRFGNGKQVRDILYVLDIIRALYRCIDKIDSISGQVFNIAGGPQNTISVLELLSLLENLTGNKEKSIINPSRKADKLVMYLDISKAKHLLDWEPTVGKEEGIARLVKWTVETLA